jgi:hypothetical protein
MHEMHDCTIRIAPVPRTFIRKKISRFGKSGVQRIYVIGDGVSGPGTCRFAKNS